MSCATDSIALDSAEELCGAPATATRLERARRLVSFANQTQFTFSPLGEDDLRCVEKHLEELESAYAHYCIDRARAGHDLLFMRLQELSLAYGNVSMECSRARFQEMEDEIRDVQPAQCEELGKSLDSARSIMVKSGIYPSKSETCIRSTVSHISGPLTKLCAEEVLTPRTAFEAGYAEIFERCRVTF